MADTIQIYCPNCNTQFEVPDEMLGQAVECTECGTQFEITLPEQSAEVAAQPVAEEEEPSVVSACPGCATLFEVPVSMVGETVECTVCGVAFTVEERKSAPSGTDTVDDVALHAGEETGATNTIKMSRTSIGMVPVVQDSYQLGVVDQQIQKTEMRRAFESGEFAIKAEDLPTEGKAAKAAAEPPKKKKPWWMFWKR